MKKIVLISFIFSLFTSHLLSQDFSTPAPQKPKPVKEKKPFPDKDKIYFGGGLGGGITQTNSFINLSPIVGYKITSRYSAGVGVTYIYLQDHYYQPPIKLNIIGGNIFNRYLITNFLFAHVEYELLNGNWYIYRKPFLLQNVWVGGGLRQHVGNSSLMIMALWNLNETEISNTYFHSPQIRMGIGIGL